MKNNFDIMREQAAMITRLKSLLIEAAMIVDGYGHHDLARRIYRALDWTQP